jgi:two-component sensor histidine kinase
MKPHIRPTGRVTWVTLVIGLLLGISLGSWSCSWEDDPGKVEAITVGYPPFESATLFYVAEDQRFFSRTLKTPIFRISQEAMNNISKHSQASLIKLSLQKEDDIILLTIQDNGQGFDPETARKRMGLSSIKERAELSGGSSELKSAMGKGTMIRVSWPI